MNKNQESYNNVHLTEPISEKTKERDLHEKTFLDRYYKAQKEYENIRDTLYREEIETMEPAKKIIKEARSKYFLANNEAYEKCKVIQADALTEYREKMRRYSEA